MKVVGGAKTNLVNLVMVASHHPFENNWIHLV